MNLAELLKQLKATDDRLDALLAHDELTDEQRAEHDRLLAERKKTQAAIKREQDRQARAAERADLEGQAEQARLAEERAGRSVPAPRRTDADQPGARVTSVKLASVDDPKKGFRTPREYLMCVKDAGEGRRVDDRLRSLQMTVGSDEARGNSDPAGGYLVPEAFMPGVLKINAEDDPMGMMTTKVPMRNPIVRFNSRVDKNHTSSVSGGLTVTRRPETVAATPSQMTFDQVVMEAHMLMGLSYATEEILTDSPESFIAILEAGFSDQFVSHLVNERLNGTGVGEYQGIGQCAALVTVSKETSQPAATIYYENVINMRARCWGYAKAAWMANHDCMPQLMLMNQSVGTGGIPVWQPSGREDHPDILLGRPLYFTEYCKTLGTTGDLILANWGEYLEGVYQPMQSAESIHVRFVNHERAYKFWTRNAGQPWWKSALTTKNSTNTLSPFVYLQTRS